jgi:hypothetical protein
MAMRVSSKTICEEDSDKEADELDKDTTFM